MRKRLGFLLLLLLIPDMAWANSFVPSFVDIVSSPLIWSLYVITLVITVPVIMLIGYVETRTVRKYIAKSTFGRVFVQICILNAITSLIRLPFTGYRVIWPGLPLSYLITIPAEALLILLCLRKHLAVKTVGSALAISARMNTASYAVLTVILVGIVYIPLIGVEHPDVGRLAEGRLVIDPDATRRVFDFSPRRFVIGDADDYGRPDDRAVCVAQGDDGTVIRVVPIDPDNWERKDLDAKVVSSRIDGDHWVDKSLGEVKGMQQIEAISRDGSLLVCQRKDKWIIYDRIRDTAVKLPGESIDPSAAFLSDQHQVLLTTRAEHSNQDGSTSTDYGHFLWDSRSGKLAFLVGETERAVFSPNGSKLAWKSKGGVTVYDCARSIRRVIKVRGRIDGPMAWSPDGKLIACIGSANPFVTTSYWRDIRVIDVRSGHTAVLYRDVYTAGLPNHLLWLP